MKKLYTLDLFDSQVNFIRKEIEKLNNDEGINQRALHNEGEKTSNTGSVNSRSQKRSSMF
jgi:hypothetical protein